METVARFRRIVLCLSLSLTALAGGIVFFLDTAFSKGIIIGGTASTLGFLIAARNAKFAYSTRNKIMLSAIVWRTIRMLLYSLVLYKAYSFDTAHLHGFFGAAIGLVIVRLVVTLVGFTGWDLRKAD